MKKRSHAATYKSKSRTSYVCLPCSYLLVPVSHGDRLPLKSRLLLPTITSTATSSQLLILGHSVANLLARLRVHNRYPLLRAKALTPAITLPPAMQCGRIKRRLVLRLRLLVRDIVVAVVSVVLLLLVLLGLALIVTARPRALGGVGGGLGTVVHVDGHRTPAIGATKHIGWFWRATCTWERGMLTHLGLFGMVLEWCFWFDVAGYFYFDVGAAVAYQD